MENSDGKPKPENLEGASSPSRSGDHEVSLHTNKDDLEAQDAKGSRPSKALLGGGNADAPGVKTTNQFRASLRLFSSVFFSNPRRKWLIGAVAGFCLLAFWGALHFSGWSKSPEGGPTKLHGQEPILKASSSSENKIAKELPHKLEWASCDMILVGDSIRKEFLESRENAVRLRIYDCLELSGRFVDRESFSKGVDGEEVRLYRKISDFLNGLKLSGKKANSCHKSGPNDDCFDFFQDEADKTSKKSRELISESQKKKGLFLSGIYLLLAQDELKKGKMRGFQNLSIEALKVIPEYLTGLRSSVLTWAQTKLIVSGDIAIARQLNEFHKKALEGENEIYAWAARYLYLYSYSEKREQLVSLAFSRVGAIQLVKSPVMLEILVPEAMKLGMGRDFLAQLDFMREFYQTEDGRDQELGEKMMLWKVRAQVFLGEFTEADNLLSSWYKAGLPISGDFWFVRGLLAGLRSNSKEALQFLKKARELGMVHWGILWNLALGSAQLGQKASAQKFLGEFRAFALIEAKEKEAWGLLLEAEISSYFQDNRSAYSLVKRFLRINPAHLRGWELLSGVTGRMGRRSESIKARMKVDELRGQLRYYVSDRYLYAPNGPLAGLR